MDGHGTLLYVGFYLIMSFLRYLNILKQVIYVRKEKSFYQYSEKKLNYKYINDSNFQKLESKTCLELNDNNKYLYIIGYSINDKIISVLNLRVIYYY